MREVLRSIDRRRAERAVQFHGQVDRPHPTGIDHDAWVGFHGEPLTYVVEKIVPPDGDGCNFRVVGYSDRELVELANG